MTYKSQLKRKETCLLSRGLIISTSYVSRILILENSRAQGMGIRYALDGIPNDFLITVVDGELSPQYGMCSFFVVRYP